MSNKIQNIPENNIVEHYISGDYWKNRENSDSTYKIALLESLIQKYKIVLPSPLKIAEVGCGQGAFLLPLADRLNRKQIEYRLFGYDIAADAIALAQSRNPHGDRLSFAVGSAEDIPAQLDAIFCMDVLEHVENPFAFLRSLAGKSTYVILHLPIEQSFGHLLRRCTSTSYQTFQHIHFYSWETARILIDISPFELVGYQFTADAEVSLKVPGSLMTKFLRIIRYFIYKINPNLAAILSGGSVLLLLKNS